ncbi:MAG: yusP/MdtP-like protein [Parcubacteria group bacterium]|nr:yusP/MdtP-like protein [Parcubacteria group bacterium]
MTDVKNKFPILAGILLAILLAAMDQTIVATAMPEIVRELHGLEHLSWVFTAYMLASTITVPIYGKLSDLLGRRTLYIVAIIIFLLGSILSGAAHTMLQLILFRGIQGIGGGAIMVTSIALIADIFPPAERGKWMGIIGGAFGIASIAGPLLGGWITDNVSWRWVFYVNIPLALIAIVVLSLTLPKIARKVEKVYIDYLGAFLLMTTLVPFLLAVVWGGSTYPWGSGEILSLFGIAFISLFFFVWREESINEPILSLRLFGNRAFTLSVLATLLTAAGMFGAILYIPLFSQTVLGSSATGAGLALTPMMLALVVASATSGQIVSRTGHYRYIVIGGIALSAIAVYLFSTIGPETTTLGLSLRMVLLGLGLGPTMSIFNIVVQNAFDARRTGEVTAAVQMFRSIGGTIGTAILGGVMNAELAHRLASGASQAVAFSGAVDRVFFFGTFFLVTAFALVLFLPQLALRKSNRPKLEEAGIELEQNLGHTDMAHSSS